MSEDVRKLESGCESDANEPKQFVLRVCCDAIQDNFWCETAVMRRMRGRKKQLAVELCSKNEIFGAV